MRTRLVSWLLRLYPHAWRAEYGAELRGMLLRRPLSAAIVVDVAMSALWQRVRAMEASTVAGIGLMLVTIAALVSNVMAPPGTRSQSASTSCSARCDRNSMCW